MYMYIYVYVYILLALWLKKEILSKKIISSVYYNLKFVVICYLIVDL